MLLCDRETLRVEMGAAPLPSFTPKVAQYL